MPIPVLEEPPAAGIVATSTFTAVVEALPATVDLESEDFLEGSRVRGVELEGLPVLLVGVVLRFGVAVGVVLRFAVGVCCT